MYLLRVFYLCMSIQLAIGSAGLAQTNKLATPESRSIKLMTCFPELPEK